MRYTRMRLKSGVDCLGAQADDPRLVNTESNLLTVAAYSFLSQSMFRVEKYRPDTLDDVVSHKDITGTSELRFEKYTSPAIATDS